jgi:hypothetical protein
MMPAADYEKQLADWGLSYGVTCEHNGMINEGAVFMFIAPAEPPWVYALVLRGDLNNFYEGQIAKAHCGMSPVAEMPEWPTGWGTAP